ncbi:hypothetical protein Nepgr_000595 [Nepenthes gracilis]|uniref:J domain-containing protein n=1 Tax=Nepenthes gracilis TaxID=150966 RepID=A0AAD3P3F7_NEPGR|nr:hypothetical protein Nepgr_000595 [Nepenthes gracilis]
MESKQEEALKAKENAEKRFAAKDFVGAKNYALKAQALFPELNGISQMVATFDVYIASEAKVNGEIDLFSVLGLKPSADRSTAKKQYKKLAVLLHPDKNRTVGADGAFKLVSEAWTLLSDRVKRGSEDLKRNSWLSTTAVHGAAFSDTCSKPHLPPTFWTLCTSCQVQYEYHRKYVNKRLSCKNCRATFMAVELVTAPLDGSYPVCPWSYMSDNGYRGDGYNSVQFFPTDGIFVTVNGIPQCHGSEYMPFQWNTYPGTCAGYVDPNGLMSPSSDTICHANGYVCKPGKTIKVVDTNADGSIGYNECTKATSPYKRRKVEFGGVTVNGNEVGSKVVSEATMANGSGSNGVSPKICSPDAPWFDARSLLIEKARTEIQKKLEEMKPAWAAGRRSGEGRRKGNLDSLILMPKKTRPLMLSVPDSDFHDFDRERAEECFRPKQIWALYDEDDGMPRLYCVIRAVISVKPFKIHISYLSSKTDAEFGPVNWINSGFTKSCGNFRACNSDTVEQVNMFSHLLGREKAGRGGCVRIYPKSGDIWAVYRNWSPDWKRTTPNEVRHQYEMVEVLADYSEELGVRVITLTKLDGFKTVYRRDTSDDAIRWIPKKEMVRFSHRVPSWLLKEVDGLPKGCWDLDPAATPDVLLRAARDVKVEDGSLRGLV